MKAFIQAIEYYLPETTVDNQQLATEFQDWDVAKIEAKTGIAQRHVAAEGECASDMAVAAVRKLFATGACEPSEIDFLLFCTQSPDYLLPTTACLLQHRLGLPQQCGALDFNLGCSGFVYGLGIAKGLIESDQAQKVLLITGDTYSKMIHPKDKSVRTIFGDAATATLLTGDDADADFIGPFINGSDGSGGENLIVPTGGFRRGFVENADLIKDAGGSCRTVNNLFMDGPEIFNFSLRVVPETVVRLLEKSGRTAESIDHWVLHQANRYMLEHLRKRLGVPAEKFVISMATCGNTVSSTIPIALKELSASGHVHAGQTLLLLGFGVGYSWSGTLLRWHA